MALGRLREALGRQLGRDLALQALGVGAVLGREGEEAAPIELRLVQELEEQVVIGLGLAGIAEDERRPEGGQRIGGTDGRDPLQEPIGVTPSPHRAHQGS